MEEIEVSVEQQHETIHHHAQHSQERWLLYCALISAVLAVAAAISGLHAAHYANEAMLEQMHASDHWGYYQAKGIKSMITEMHVDMLKSDGKTASSDLQQKIDGYKKEQQEIKNQATEESDKAQYFMHQHETLAKAVTAFQIAIAITAMSAITRRKHFLLMTLALVLGGSYYMMVAFLG